MLSGGFQLSTRIEVAISATEMTGGPRLLNQAEIQVEQIDLPAGELGREATLKDLLNMDLPG